MKFGDKIRQLRHDRGWTQPQLAEAMGIEQSYLSKLENGRSLPSNDVLNRILDVFAIDIGHLVDDLDQGIRNQLRQIPDVADHFDRQKQRMLGKRRRWLLATSLFVALGAGLIYAGSVHLFFSNMVYQYVSLGVVEQGESKQIFEDQRIPLGVDPETATRIRNDIIARIDEDYLQTDEFAGNIFNVPVAGGSRTYRLRGKTEIDPWQNRAVTFVGVLMLVFGLIRFVLDKKLWR